MAGGTANLAYHNTLAGATVDTVTIQFPGVSVFEIVNRDATNTIFATYARGSTPVNPTTGGNDTFVVPPNSSKQFSLGLDGTGDLVVRLISAGTPAYSVEALA